MNVANIINYLVAETKSRSFLEVSNRKKIIAFLKIKALHKTLVTPADVADPLDDADSTLVSSVFIRETPSDFYSKPVAKLFGVVLIEEAWNSARDVEKTIETAFKYITDDGFLVIRHSYPKAESHQLSRVEFKKLNPPDRSWCGEVWRAVVKLRSTRKDLAIFTINSGWGVTVIYNGAPEADLQTIPFPDYQKFSENVEYFLNLKEQEWFISWLVSRRCRCIPKFYTENKFVDMKRYAYNRRLDGKTDVNIVDNGIILPIRRTDISNLAIYEGGVCDSELKFIAGSYSGIYKPGMRNRSCASSYHVSQNEITNYNESAVFAGILEYHFGHALLDGMSRWWWLAQNPRYDGKLAFLSLVDSKERSPVQIKLLSLLGVDPNRVVIIDTPARFTRITVPEQSNYRLDAYRDSYINIFTKIRNSVVPGTLKKVYFTRRFLDKNDTFNELYFEKFYERQGFNVIAPEKLPIEEQISIIAGCKEFACVQGTLPHLMLFAQNKAKITILRRTTDFQVAQIPVNFLRDLDVTYVDVSSNFLPVFHTRGPFMLTATPCWQQYVLENYPHEVENIQTSDRLPSIYIADFIQQWVHVYSDVALYDKYLSKMTSIDFLARLAKYFTQMQIDKNNFNDGHAEKNKR